MHWIIFPLKSLHIICYNIYKNTKESDYMECLLTPLKYESLKFIIEHPIQFLMMLIPMLGVLVLVEYIEEKRKNKKESNIVIIKRIFNGESKE